MRPPESDPIAEPDGSSLLPQPAVSEGPLGSPPNLSDPQQMVRRISQVSSLEEKTRLLWSLTPMQREQVLDGISAPLIAALVQNLGESNLRLLGDISAVKYNDLLSMSDNGRKYAWLQAAMSLDDARAKALPLLTSNEDLVDALLSRLEYVDHVRAIGDAPIEHMRLPPEAMADPAQAILDLYGADLMRDFPVPEPGLARVLQQIIDYDPDRYADLIRRSLRKMRYAEEHADVERELREEPILLRWLPAVPSHPDPTRGSPLSTQPSTRTTPHFESTDAIVPLGMVQTLPGLAAGLDPERRASVERDLQALLVREAIAAGGSFAVDDLKPIVSRIEVGLLLGLEVLSPGPQAMGSGRVLGTVPLREILEAGAVRLEHLRQAAIRLRPFHGVLDDGQRSLLESLVLPQLVLGPDGQPGLAILAGEGGELAFAEIPALEGRLVGLAAWVAMARALGVTRTEAALSRCDDVDAVLAGAALTTVLYRRVDLELAELSDIIRFGHRYLTPRGAVRKPAARAIEEVTSGWAGAHDLDTAETLSLLRLGLERLADAARSPDSPAGALRARVCVMIP